MHSNGRFKGKLTERWGRKASGLRDASAYDSGVAGSNVNPLRAPPPCAASRGFDRSSHRSRIPQRCGFASFQDDDWTCCSKNG